MASNSIEDDISIMDDTSIDQQVVPSVATATNIRPKKKEGKRDSSKSSSQKNHPRSNEDKGSRHESGTRQTLEDLEGNYSQSRRHSKSDRMNVGAQPRRVASATEHIHDRNRHRMSVTDLEAEKRNLSNLRRQQSLDGATSRPGAFREGGHEGSRSGQTVRENRLSMKELENEKRNLSSLRRKQSRDGATSRPGAFPAGGEGAFREGGNEDSRGEQAVRENRLSVKELENEKRNLSTLRRKQSRDGATTRPGAFPSVGEEATRNSAQGGGGGDRMSMQDLETEKRHLASLRRNQSLEGPGAFQAGPGSLQRASGSVARLSMDELEVEKMNLATLRKQSLDGSTQRPGAVSVPSMRDSERLSMGQLEAEKRNLVTLQSQGDNYYTRLAPPTRSVSHDPSGKGFSKMRTPARSKSTEGPDGGSSALQVLESSVLRKSSVTSTVSNGAEKDSHGMESGSGHLSVSRRTSRSSVGTKSEQGLIPGGSRPGAFEAQYTTSAATSRSSSFVEVDPTDPIPSIPTFRGLEVHEERIPVPPPAVVSVDVIEERKSKPKRKKILLVVAFVVIVACVGAGVGIALSGGSTASSPDECEDAECCFPGEVQPSVRIQCECFGEIQILSESTMTQYMDLVSELESKIYGSYDEEYDSCSTRNIAAAHVASTERLDKDTQVQRFLLVFLYLSWDGDNWRQADGWLSSIPECSWFGMSCDGKSVTSIDLSLNGLDGAFVPEQLYLESLERFIVDDNPKLSGELVEDLFLLSNLQVLSMQNMEIFGTIPTTIGQLTALRKLNIHSEFSPLAGTIPTELALLDNLEYIHLSAFLLDGIPSEMGMMTNLKHFNVSMQFITGTFPSEMYSLTKLTGLDMRHNQMTGTIPNITLFPDLNVYGVGHNSFDTGQNVDNVWKMSDLRGLSIGKLGLSGTLPDADVLGRLTKLEYLDMHLNRFEGTIPSGIGNLKNLGYAYFAGNMLSGTIPSQIGLLTSIFLLDFNTNRLTGTVPSELLELTSLEALNLSGNHLTGTLSSGFCDIEKLGLDCDKIPCPCNACKCASGLVGGT